MRPCAPVEGGASQHVSGTVCSVLGLEPKQKRTYLGSVRDWTEFSQDGIIVAVGVCVPLGLLECLILKEGDYVAHGGRGLGKPDPAPFPSFHAVTAYLINVQP